MKLYTARRRDAVFKELFENCIYFVWEKMGNKCGCAHTLLIFNKSINLGSRMNRETFFPPRDKLGLGAQLFSGKRGVWNNWELVHNPGHAKIPPNTNTNKMPEKIYHPGQIHSLQPLNIK